MRRPRPPQKILMTADVVGGVWTYALDLTRELTGRGAEVTLAAMGCPAGGPDPARARAARDAGAARVEFSDAKLEWMPDPWEDVRRAGLWLRELARESESEMIHLNQFAFGALDWDAPTLVMAHSCVGSWFEAVRGCAAPPEWARYRGAVALGLAGADALAAPSRAMASAAERLYEPPAPVRVIANGRAAGLFAPGEKEPFVLGAGRVWDPAKNLAALDAAAGSANWPVKIAGAVIDASGRSAVPTRAEWIGELAPGALAEVVSRAAIFASPALYEPFGLSILEAALSGCALVLGNIESLREIWGEAAVYAPPSDPEALAAAINYLIERPDLLAEMAARAKERAADFTIAAAADGVEAAYEEARARRAARRGRQLAGTSGARSH